MNLADKPAIRAAIAKRIRNWQEEGDTASRAELIGEAFLHLRWWLDRDTLRHALDAMLRE